MTTIEEVALAAGVSTATVSRVMNGTTPVTSGRAERVRAAAAELHYRPFGPAQALRRQRTSVWTAIIADIENPFFTAMIRGIEDVAVEHHHRLVLCNSDEDVAKEKAYIDIAIEDRVAGVVIAVTTADAAALDALVAAGIPIVAVDRRPARDGIDSVEVDNRLGARLATAHLLESGARRVGCITGPARLSTATTRLAGYMDALADHGAKPDRSLIRRGDFRKEGGYRAAQALLELADPPDALFVANNLMTVGALQAIRDAGRRIPEDVGVIGFDDAPWTTLLTPTLSVVAQPTYEIGRQAARLLATAAADLGPRHIVLAPSLIIRESSERSHP